MDRMGDAYEWLPFANFRRINLSIKMSMYFVELSMRVHYFSCHICTAKNGFKMIIFSVNCSIPLVCLDNKGGKISNYRLF